MNLSVGIVGLPNVGKSTLFNALLKKRVALSANYPFATIEPNVGVVAVPDERLNKLAEMVAREEILRDKDTKILGDDALNILISQYLPPIVPAVVQFIDIAGLVKGASEGAGLGNKFLAHIREVDAVIHVVRDFADENVVREGAENPEADKMTVETELAIADLATLEKLISSQEKDVKTSKDKLEFNKLEILNKIKDKLNSGDILEENEIDEKLKEWFRKLPLLSIKPVLYVLNVSEGEYANKIKNDTPLLGGVLNDNYIIISARLEEELADYSEEERVEYLKSVGIEKTGLERLIVKAYNLLGLISFLTAGPKEARAWTIKRGTKAPRAAGVIHTDFEKKFIKAEVAEFNELMANGGWRMAKEKGKVRFEGRDYVVRDGDVVEFKIGS